MTYEYMTQYPGRFAMIIILSLLITVAAYGLLPLITACTRSEPITSKKYKRMCHLLNIIPLVLFVLMNGGKTRIIPYLLWTGIFRRLGEKILTNRSLLEEEEEAVRRAGGTLYVPEASDQVVRCKACGYTSGEMFNGCPKCGKFAKEVVRVGSQPADRSDVTVPLMDSNVPVVLPCVPKQENSAPVTPAIPSATPEGTQRRYCDNCGDILPDGALFCRSCGKRATN